MTGSDNAQPLISVILPMRNAAPFLREAVDSVLAQSFSDFELVVVDDGSIDDGPDIVESYEDPRIRLLRKTKSGGISKALLAGIAASSSPLVARMDADDVSLSDRFALQVAFLDAHPEVVAVGTTPILMDEAGDQRQPYPLLTRDADLRRSMTYKGPFCHGSVMMRRHALEAAGGYLSAEEPAEDYGLWLRLATHGQLANLAEALYCLRKGEYSVSSRNRERQLDRLLELRDKARSVVGDPRLSWPDLRAGRLHYRRQEAESGLRLERRFSREMQELACIDVVRRGPMRAARNVALSIALTPLSPRALRDMWHYLHEEQNLMRSRGRST